MKIIAAILLIVLATTNFAQTYNGDLTITNDWELHAFNYTKVNGVLRITQQFGAPEITSLTPLSNLTSVGKLVLDGLNIQDLNGLQNLSEVSTYQADSSNFMAIYPCIFIQNCAVTSLTGIGNFTRNNPRANLNILIQYNNSLVDMSGFFTNLDTLTSSLLNIQNNSQLVNSGYSLSTFNIYELAYQSNNNLKYIDFVNNAVIDKLNITLCPSLNKNTSIRLNSIREIYLDENSSVQNLNLYADHSVPYGKHKRIGVVRFHALKSISGLSSIPSNPIDSFLSTFALSDNDSLSQIEEVSSDSIQVISTSVPNGGYSHMNSGIIIVRCNNLTNLDFLRNVVEVKLGLGLNIINNLKLVNCCGVYKLLNSQRVNEVNINSNPFACNSSYEIIITCGPTSFSAGNDTTVCSGQAVTITATGASSYSWNTGQTTASITVSPTTTTSYIVTGIVDGISQKDTVFVNIHPTKSTNRSQTICQGQTYSFNGMNLSTAGTYRDTLQQVNGCDSFIVLTLNVNPAKTTNRTQTICQGQSYSFNGMNLSTAGTYRDTLQQVNGCDSFIVLTLNVNPAKTTNRTQTICQGQTYSFNGMNLSTAGIYRDTLQQVNGCDSFIVLTLNVNPSKTTNITQTIQSGQTYPFNGMSLTTAGTYRDTLQQVNGCDSFIVLTLSVITGMNNNISFLDQLAVYPNPAEDYISIELSSKKSADFQLEIIGIDGKVYWQRAYNSTRIIQDKISLSDLANGMYFLKIRADYEQVLYKIIKK